jgi:hypothetical protein
MKIKFPMIDHTTLRQIVSDMDSLRSCYVSIYDMLEGQIDVTVPQWMIAYRGLRELVRMVTPVNLNALDGVSRSVLREFAKLMVSTGAGASDLRNVYKKIAKNP